MAALELATILIVEDSAVQAELLRRTIEAAGYAVLVARNGAEGLAMAGARHPAAVVSDINMPEMDGCELCHRMRQDKDLRDTPVILLTMLSEVQDVIRGVNAGADCFLTKPCNEQRLRSCLGSLIAEPHIHDEVPIEMRVEIDGQPYEIRAGQQRVLKMLVSTYSNAVQQNRELMALKDELSAAAKDLTRSNAELQQFAYVASHDLQEPLRMVISYVQLLEKRLADKLDADTRELMGFAVDGAQRMQNLIQDILAYSRVNTKGQPLAQVDSAEVLKEALALLANRIAERGAEVDTQSLPIVMADRTQLVQLFQNLIGNAIKFCKDHAPRIRVAAAHEAGQWRFSITDNGIGVAPEYRGQIFVIFKRLHTRREYPGTGIGLAICKRIVERHGGEIGVEPAPGGGSVFWFTIPEEKGK